MSIVNQSLFVNVNMLNFLVFCSLIMTVLGGAEYKLRDSMINTRLDGRMPVVRPNASMSKCMRMCEVIVQCMSMNYNIKTRRCELFDQVASDSVPLVFSANDVHITVDDWKRHVRNSTCLSRPCPNHEACFPNGASDYVCSYPRRTDSAESTSGGTSDSGSSSSSDQVPSAQTSAPTTTTTTESTTIQATTTSGTCVTRTVNESLDSALTASSTKLEQGLPADYYAPKWARLYTTANGTVHGGGWMADANNGNQYFQIEFSNRRTVYFIFVQGYNGENAWVTSYKVQYSTDCDTYSTVLDFGGTHETFQGPSSSESVVLSFVYPEIEAKCVRVVPLTWYNEIAMRVEIIACEMKY